jgi:GH25 family lysozyme M1 (1,4-beta-N-acetylmuramidase)
VGAATLSGSLTSAPQVINVSQYDPKERQRSGSSYSVSDLSALRRNGALALIARCGKGKKLDEKCASFLAAAERQGMRLGAYYFVLDGVDAVWQADRFVDRLRAIKASKRLRTEEILMVGDFDQASSVSDIVRFIDRIEQRTGSLPMIYLENSKRLRATLSAAPTSSKRRIRQCPYWLALYSDGEPGMETPSRLMRQYGIWSRWVLWQYGGVHWDTRRGRSQPKHYNAGRWRSPTYFGNLDRPTERNAFNGSVASLHRFWLAQAWRW